MVRERLRQFTLPKIQEFLQAVFKIQASHDCDTSNRTEEGQRVTQVSILTKATFSKVLRHLLTSTMQPSFDGPLWAIEHFGNLFDGEFLLIKQNKTLLIFRS